MEYEVYNAGDTIEETIKFSLSRDSNDHATGNYPFRLESREFTAVPTELTLGDGEATLRVEFPFDIQRKFGARGVVLLIDAKEKKRRFGAGDIPETQAFAVGREEAVERGKQLWYGYTLKIAEDHVNEAMQSRAVGGLLRKAQGFTARCLKLHNIVDPADEMYLRMTQGAGGAQLDKLQGDVAQLTTALNAVLTIPGVKEALAAAGAQLPVAAKAPAPQGGKSVAHRAKQHNSGNAKRNPERLPEPQRAAPPNETA